jgi:uncharacterized membrane protein YczE
MTGLARRDHSIRSVRTSIEAVAALVGLVLGGSIGVGTVVYALAIGPLVQVFLPRDAVADHAFATPDTTSEPKAALT